MNPIRWALVGASTIAREWMCHAITAEGAGQILAVVSQSQERAAQFAAEFNIPHASNALDAVLANPEIDAVYISTTNGHHFAQAIAAMKAGKHVLCEKPLALTLEEAREMVAVSQQMGVVMATNHHLRNAATHRKMRELVQTGAIGKPLFARVSHAVYLPEHLQGWRLNRPEEGGGVILDITVHDVDTLRFIFGANPLSTVGIGRNSQMAIQDLEDGVMAVIEFENGVLAQVHDAFTTRFAETGIEIHGTEGSIFAKNVMTQKAVGTIELKTEAGMSEVAVEHENLYVRSVRCFHDAVRGLGLPAATGEDGVWSLATALAVQEACRTYRRVYVAI